MGKDFTIFQKLKMVSLNLVYCAYWKLINKFLVTGHYIFSMLKLNPNENLVDIKSFITENNLSCILEHPRFEKIFDNVYVQSIVFLKYILTYKENLEMMLFTFHDANTIRAKDINIPGYISKSNCSFSMLYSRSYRWAAYKGSAYFLWGKLWKRNRLPLPACIG